MKRTVASQWLKGAKLLHNQRYVRSNLNGQRGLWYRMYMQVRRHSGRKNHNHPLPTVPSPHGKVFRDAEPPFHIRLHIAVTTDMAVLPAFYAHW